MWPLECTKKDMSLVAYCSEAEYSQYGIVEEDLANSFRQVWVALQHSTVASLSGALHFQKCCYC